MKQLPNLCKFVVAICLIAWTPSKGSVSVGISSVTADANGGPGLDKDR